MNAKEIVAKHYEKDARRHEWMPKQEEHELLIQLVLGNDIESYFEIGAYEGFTMSLVETCPSIKEVKGLDVGDYAGHTKIVVCKSINYVVDRSWDMVFIDGCHAANSVINDTIIALKMKPKIIVWHDAKMGGIKTAIEFFHFENLNIEGNLAWVVMP